MTSLIGLPAPALQAVLEHFCSSPELGSAERSAAAATARLTCKRWADVSCATINAIAPKNAASLVRASHKFKALTAVDLRYIRSVDASAISCFSQLRCLRHLSLVHSACWDAVCGPILQTVAASCPYLTHLDVSTVSDKLAGQLAQLTQLLCLSVSGRLKDHGLQKLSSIQGLQQLSISCCDGITDEGLSVLTALQHASNIQLHSCLQLTDQALALIGQLTQLTALSLSHSCEDATGAGLLCLSTLKNLQHLNLSAASEGASPEALAQLLAALTQLTLLDVSYCEHVGPSVLRAIAGLQHLRVLGISGISPGSLHSLRCLRSLTNLQHLQMRWIGMLRDAAFLPHLAALTSVDLSYCRSLTGDALQQLQWLTQLQALNLMGVGSEDLSCLPTLQQLTGLTVSLLTPTSVSWQHIAGLSGLRELALRRCSISTGRLRKCDRKRNMQSGSFSSFVGISSNSSTDSDTEGSGGVHCSSSSASGGSNEGLPSCPQPGSSSNSEAYATVESNVDCLARLKQLTALDFSSSVLQAAALTVLLQLPLMQHLALSRCQNVSSAVLRVLAGCSALRKLDLRLRCSGCSWSLPALLGLLEQLPGLGAVYVTEVPSGLPEREACRVLACSSEHVLLPVARDVTCRMGLNLQSYEL